MAKYKLLTSKCQEIKFTDFSLDNEGLYFRSYGSRVVGFVLDENSKKEADYYRAYLKDFVSLLSKSSNIDDFFENLDNWYESNSAQDDVLDEIHNMFKYCFSYDTNNNNIIINGLDYKSTDRGILINYNGTPLIDLYMRSRGSIWTSINDPLPVSKPSPNSLGALAIILALIIAVILGYNNKNKIKDFLAEIVNVTDTTKQDTTKQDTTKVVTEESYALININTYNQGNGYISVSDKNFQKYKVYFSKSNKKLDEINWKEVTDYVDNNQNVYIKESGTIYFRGQEGSKIGMASIQLDYGMIIANLFLSHSMELEKIFIISDEPFHGTKVYVNGERLQSKSLLGDQIINDCLASGGKITKIETEDEHKSILDPEYPKITRIEFNNN